MIEPQFQGAESKLCAYCGKQFHRDKRCTWKHWGKAKFCSRGCSGAYGGDLHRHDFTLSEQFDRFVIRHPQGCWGWKGAVNAAKGGYAVLMWRGRNYYGHLVSLELDGRKVPKGMMGCHHCDNPVCSNPEHLYVGTPKQNMQDAVRRGRVRRGETCATAKLTEEAVRFIRSSSMTVGEMAQRFGVTHGAISMARDGKTWRHVA
jgi:hypothetical protein